MLNRFKDGWILKALLVLLGFALLASVELGLRLSGFGDEYEFVIESPKHPYRRRRQAQGLRSIHRTVFRRPPGGE